MDTEARIESILALVRASGGRATSARRGILRALLDHHDVHPTVEHLTATVQTAMPDVAESTVYRFLDELERLDVVRSVRLGTGPAAYHFSEDTDHHHLVCSECGRITAIPEGILETMRNAVRRDYAFEIQLQHLTMTGRCVQCPPPADQARTTDGHHHPHVHG